MIMGNCQTNVLRLFLFCVALSIVSTASGQPAASKPEVPSVSDTSSHKKSVTEINGFSDYDPTVMKYAYVAAAAIWIWPEGAQKIIYVCWENPQGSFGQEEALVRQAVSETWQAYSKLEFEGWQRCVPGNYGIHIKVDDSGPHTQGLGRQLDRMTDGMVLNFTFNNWSQPCKSSEPQKRSCIYSIAIHEFGHAIGWAHEQNRFDAPGECQNLKQGPNGDLLLTPYDPESVMNYCNEKYNNDGKLSDNDKRAVAQIYGAK
jgi:hypothetical protein